MSQIDVELVNVEKRFGDFTAVRNVSFSILRGSFFSLLGPSGCGKTTILRMISGFEEPTSGTIHIAGRSMAGIPPYRRPTNLVFQHLSLFPHLNVFKNIGFGLEMKGVSSSEVRRSVEKMLELIELPGYGLRRINQLSGGQQQRVAIARALVNNPTVVLLDEPLGALDLKLRNQMQLELKRIQREVGATFIYVTHDQGEAITMSDHIAVMNRGNVEQIGPSDEIYERPRTAFVAGFIGETNLIEGELRRVNDRESVVGTKNLSLKVLSPEVGTGRVNVSIRPERIVIGPTPADSDNIFSGRVAEVVYQGDHSTYKVELGDGPVLTVKVQNTETNIRYSIDDLIQVGWTAGAGVVVPAKNGDREND